MKDTEGVYMLVCALKYCENKKDKTIPKMENKTVWTNTDTVQTMDYSFVPRVEPSVFPVQVRHNDSNLEPVLESL